MCRTKRNRFVWPMCCTILALAGVAWGQYDPTYSSKADDQPVVSEVEQQRIAVQNLLKTRLEIVSIIEDNDLADEFTIKSVIRAAEELGRTDIADILRDMSKLGLTDEKLHNLLWPDVPEIQGDPGEFTLSAGADTCATAQVISSFPFGDNTVTNDSATADADVSCNGAAASAFFGIWYTFTPAVTSTFRFGERNTSTGSVGQDVVWTVYTGGCGTLVESFCSDTDSGTTLTTSVTGGVQYWVLVSRKVATASTSPNQRMIIGMDLSPGTGSAPANESCAGAIAMGSPPSSVFGSNFFAPAASGADETTACGTDSGPTQPIWYTVIGTGNPMTLTTCNPDTGTDDTRLSVFTGACGALTCVTGNDDSSCSPPPASPTISIGFLSTVNWNSTLGTVYRIRVGTFSTTSRGSFRLSLTETPQGGCCNGTSCSITTQAGCISPNVYLGDGSTCSGSPCATGACCQVGGSCSPTVNAASCTGFFRGNGTNCSQPCPTLGACCSSTCPNCSITSQAGCLSPSTYAGDNTTCSPTNTCLVSNDSCATAIPVTNGAPAFTGDNCCASAVDDSEAPCQANSGKDVWLSYTATCNGAVRLTTEGSISPQTDTVLSATNGCGGASLGCDDDSGTGNLSDFTISGVSSGQVIKIRMASFSTGCGGYKVNISCIPAVCGNNIIEPGEVCDGSAVNTCVFGCNNVTCQCNPPTNDTCGTAIVVTNGTPAASSNNCGAGPDVPATACAPTQNDVWYSYTSTCTGGLVIDTEGSAQTDTVLALYSACGGTELACDDEGGTGSLSRIPSTAGAAFPVTTGTTYKIRVATYNGFGAVCGGFHLNITCTAAVCGNGIIEPGETCDGPGALGVCTAHGCNASCQCAGPANDNCSGAITVVNGNTPFDRAFATTDGAAHPLAPCAFPFGDSQIHNDIWFKYIAPTSGRLFVDTCSGAGVDTRIAIYPECACLPSVAPTGCNDDSGGGGSDAPGSSPPGDPDLCMQGGASPYESATAIQITQGNCYLIRVGGFSESSTGDASADVLTISSELKGACCLGADHSCVGGTVLAECNTLMGTFFAGQACDGLQECCLPNGTCANLDPLCCGAAGGTSGGPGTSCGSNVACCIGGTCSSRTAFCCGAAMGTVGGLVCEGDVDMDGVDGDCGDGCPNDPNKLAPGICGCGVSDVDTDGDGTADCHDGCPMDPNKVSPGACGCGVPDTDTDGDGTPDCHDGCPMDPNKTAPGACGCGVSDVDTDHDGTPDCHDGCPNDPNKTSPGICGCGVSDIDTDGDGTADCHDGCPMDPNKTAPGACGCGVSDVDTDGDGTPDCHDGCPNNPALTAPGVCGCSTVDTDGDGTLDCVDGCPMDPNKIAPGACGCGTPDTDTDGDGTPDCHDGCPMDPNKIAPGACGCGTADTDSDGDGTPNCHDNCPADPNKINPGVCGCGTPDTDSDMDGVPNCNDGCPNDPNKTEPGICGCNVSDADSDGDGVADCHDVCPGQDDTIDVNQNGVPDCTGEPIPTVSEWGLVIMALLLITIGKVYFGRRQSVSN